MTHANPCVLRQASLLSLHAHLVVYLLNRWFWTSQMQEDEAYVFVNYDSRHDGRARFTPHSTIVDPDVPKDAPVRQSVETRAFVFWDE